MQAIVAPTDFSPNAALALEFAASLAQKAGAKLLLVHGCTLLEERYASYKDLIREANEAQVKSLTEKLNELKAQIAGRWQIEVSVHLYKTENISDCILQLGDERADLLVLGTYGKTGVRRKLFGSKAAEIINRSKKPVITVPPDFSGLKGNTILMAVAATERDEQTFRFVQQLATLLNSRLLLASFQQEDAEASELVTNAQHLQQLEHWAGSVFPNNPPATVSLSGTDFQETIAHYIREQEISMLAMITHERGFWENLFDSSLTQEQSYETEVPLLSLQRRK